MHDFKCLSTSASRVKYSVQNSQWKRLREPLLRFCCFRGSLCSIALQKSPSISDSARELRAGDDGKDERSDKGVFRREGEIETQGLGLALYGDARVAIRRDLRPERSSDERLGVDFGWGSFAGEEAGIGDRL